MHVEPRGRITPHCLGLWNDTQAQAFARIARFIEDRGAVPAIQLGHAGRKAGTAQPWKGGAWLPPEAGGWGNYRPERACLCRRLCKAKEMTCRTLAT